jgi:hypothetical protein
VCLRRDWINWGILPRAFICCAAAQRERPPANPLEPSVRRPVLAVLAATSILLTGCGSSSSSPSSSSLATASAGAASAGASSSPAILVTTAKPVTASAAASVPHLSRTSTVPQVSRTSPREKAAAAPGTPIPATTVVPLRTPAPSATTATSCHPLSNKGTCYEPGEFCRASDHGLVGQAGDGKTIACENNNGWRWEPV